YVSPSGFSSQERDSKAEQAHTLQAMAPQAQQAHTWSAMVLRPNGPIHCQPWFSGPTGPYMVSDGSQAQQADSLDAGATKSPG
ncbi:MAG: hypothetical protein ACK6A7_19605, partial [Planctomycetota bacterium]